jgi:4-hydroxy-2-oxoheptanedioate aldolase
MLDYRMREMWNRDELVISCWLMSGSPSVAESLGHVGYDVAVVDMQHSPMGYNEVYTTLLALSASNASPIVRVPGHEPSWTQRTLDAGAHGVMCPAVETREQAERFVDACRYPPLGSRSFGPYRAAMRPDGGDYTTRANESALAIIQIETMRGLENIDEIVSVPGLDGVFVGPVDLSLSDGGPAAMDYDDQVVAERHRLILDRCHAAGVKVGMMVQSDEQLQAIRGWGADWISIIPDSMMIVAGATQALQDVRQAIGAPAGA